MKFLKSTKTRRAFLQSTITALAALPIAPLWGYQNSTSPSKSTKKSRIDSLGPLQMADENGIMLPKGFKSRVIARSGIPPVKESNYPWHRAPDGGAIFATNDGGWIYVSNCEIYGEGGAGAIRFDASGKIIQAYPILRHTNRNCAGGATPWGSWLSCEEIEKGVVWECDPFGKAKAKPVPTLGYFTHEAIAADTQNNHLYLTEDKADGCLYRFVPDSLTSEGHPDLSNGRLEVALVHSLRKSISWALITDPSASNKPTRYQVSASTKFSGCEGIVFYNGVIFFSEKGYDRVWSYNIQTNRLAILYDVKNHPNPILTGVDNIALTQDGELLVAEDGGDLQIVAITHAHELLPLMRLVGHDASEVTGPAFSPDGKRLYFSSQRGTTGSSDGGITFEISGPFHI